MSRVGRENAKQCSSKATPCSSPEGFGELRQVAHGIGVMGSSSSHISGGHGDMALTSTSVLSHGGVMGPSP